MLVGSVWVGDVIASVFGSRAGTATARAVVDALPAAHSVGTGRHAIIAGRAPARPRRRMPSARYPPLDAWWDDAGTWFAARGLGAGYAGAEGLRILATAGEAARFVRSALPYAVAPWLAPTRRLAVHAGAIAAGGRGLLVLGRSGAGKSSVVAAALRAGSDALADDTAFLLAGGRIAGLGRPIAVARDVVPGTLRGTSHGLADSRGRVELDVPRRPGAVAHGGTMIVEHGSAPACELRPASAAEVAREITLSSYLVADPRFRTALLRRAGEAAGVSAWRLRLGTDPAGWPEAVDEVVNASR